VPRRSGAASRGDASRQSSADVADRPRHRFLEPEAEREVRRDRRGERATRAVRGACRDAPSLEDAERSAAPEEVPDPLSGGVSSRHEHRAGPEIRNPARREREVVLGLGGSHPRQPGGLPAIGRDEVGERQELPLEGAQPLVGQEGEPSGRSEDRIQHHVLRAVTPEPGGDRPNVGGAVEHSDLHGGRREVRENGIDLPADEARAERLDRHDPAGVLRGPGDDHRRSPDAVRREGQEVRLDSGAAARVGTGDRDGRRPGLLHAGTAAMATR